MLYFVQFGEKYLVPVIAILPITARELVGIVTVDTAAIMISMVQMEIAQNVQSILCRQLDIDVLKSMMF